MSNESKENNLINVVMSLNSNSPESKSSQLDRHATDLASLADKGISTGRIRAGLEVIGIKISGTYLRNYLKENFPAAYEENYTKKLIGGRKPGKVKKISKPKEIEKKKDVCQQNKPSSKKQEVSKKETSMTQAKGKSSEESSSMVQDYLNENKSK